MDFEFITMIYSGKIGIFGIIDMYKRSRLEIYFDILNVIEKGNGKPTRIISIQDAIYKTNITWNTLQKILETLLESGFIKEEIIEDSKIYQITNKGRNALSYYLKSKDQLVEAKQIIGR